MYNEIRDWVIKNVTLRPRDAYVNLSNGLKVEFSAPLFKRISPPQFTGTGRAASASPVSPRTFTRLRRSSPRSSS